MAEIDTSLYPDRLREMGIPGIPVRARSEQAVGPRLAETSDIRELARSAVPGLMRKAIEMAWGSDSLREVMDVLKEVSDRGYGKAVGQVEVRVTTQDEGLSALRELVAAGVMDAGAAREAAREIGFEWEDAVVVETGTEPDTLTPPLTEDAATEVQDI